MTAREVTSALALIVAALYFVPKYLRMGLTTIPQYLEKRFDGTTRTLVALFLVVSFVVTLLPIVLYTGALNLESIFNVSEVLNVSKTQGLWITVVVVGLLGSCYAIFGGLKAVAVSDTINGYGLLIGGLLVVLPPAGVSCRLDAGGSVVAFPGDLRTARRSTSISTENRCRGRS